MSIGENIRRKRIERDMTLDEVAALVGISRQTLCRYELGVINNIPSDKIEKIASILNTTPSCLMGWDNTEENDTDLVNGDPELTAYLEELRTRPEMRMLFSLTKDATKADVERAVAIIEALRGAGNVDT